jgi:hypothetical protein
LRNAQRSFAVACSGGFGVILNIASFSCYVAAAPSY